jgi:molybdate transport system regulatory protein
MNQIPATVVSIQRHDNLTIVACDAFGIRLQMVALNLEAMVSIQSRVLLGMNATNLLLAKEPTGDLSIPNRMPCRITHVVRGELLCRIGLDFQGIALESLIMAESANAMSLHPDTSIFGLINPNELSIIEVLA